MSRITAVIVARNEERGLSDCLRTLAWCDGILVADMGSTDRTADIARAAGARVLPVAEHGFADPARNLAYQEAEGGWIFQVDADELIPRRLGERLRTLVTKDLHDVVRVPRLNYLMGEPVRCAGWWPDMRPVFFRKGMVSYPPLVHRHMIVAPGARVIELPPDPAIAIQHFSYESTADFVERLNRYTTLEVGAFASEGRTYSTWQMLKAAAYEFYRRYFRLRGYRLGPLGLQLSLMMAAYRVVSFSKLHEGERGGVSGIRDRYGQLKAEIIAGWDGTPPASSRGPDGEA